MNKQNPPKGIEWTRRKVLIDGEIVTLPGYTWNPVTGCKHGCRWQMPDGETAICYAENVANNLAAEFYPNGFDSHYWHQNRLDEPRRVSKSAGIFAVSMGDLFGGWVPDLNVHQVLNVCRETSWHTYFLLTKNPARMHKFLPHIPSNCWVGASVPPDTFAGKPLGREQKWKMLHRTLTILEKFSETHVTWLSIEPLAWDLAPTLYMHNHALQWIVVGAASNGSQLHQPEPEWVDNVHQFADANHIPVFHKGNLAWGVIREDFPEMEDHRVRH